MQEGKLFSGSEASRIIGVPGSGIEKPNISGYPRVFVQCGDVHGYAVFLTKGTSILYKKVHIS